MGSSIRLALAALSLVLAAAPGAAAHSLPLSCSTLGAEVTVAGPDALGQILQIDQPVRIDFLTLPIRDLGAGSVRISISPLDWNGQPRDRTTLAVSTASLDPALPGATVLLSLDLAPGAYAVVAEPYGAGGIAWPRCGSIGALYRSDVLSWLPALDTGLAFDTQTTPLEVSPERAELDLAYDVAADRILAREVSGGTVETDDDDLVGAVVNHEVRVRVTTTELVDDLQVQLGLRLRALRYDGEAVRTEPNGYGVIRARDRDGTLTGLRTVASNGALRFETNWIRARGWSAVTVTDVFLGTARSFRRDGLVVAHVRTDLGGLRRNVELSEEPATAAPRQSRATRSGRRAGFRGAHRTRPAPR